MAEAVKLSKKQQKLVSESKVIDDQWARYVRARDNGHSDYLKIADKCNNFYIGNQWDPALKKKLEDEGRPALTINMVLSTVNAVLGEQTSKRVEYKYKPRNGGMESTAAVLTKLATAIKDSNDYDWAESQVFADAIIQHGRGFLDIRVKFDTNMMGDVVIKADDPRNIIIDPDAKEYDINTWKEVFETRWVSLDEIESLYGREKADALRTNGLNATRFEQDSIQWEEDAFGDAREREHTSIYDKFSEGEERTIRAVRIIERQHVKMTRVMKFVDPQTGDMKIVPESWNDKKAQQFAERAGMFLLRDIDRKVRWTTTADKVLLHDDWSPYTTFTKIPYFAFFRRGKPFGLVTNLISPQEQLNKLSSQELHILNTTANSGYIVERGALLNMTPDELRNQGAETGTVIEVAAGRMGAIEKIKPNSAPTGIENAALKSAQFIKEISGVNDAMLGFDSPELSGVALEQKSFRGQIQLQVPFDNLQRTRFMVGNKMLELVQQFYNEERVFSITTEGHSLEKMDEQEQQEFIINHQNAAGEIINDVTVGKYEVVLSIMPARDSFNDSQFAEAVNLRQIGVAIPDDRLVEYSHLEKKYELAEEIRKLTGRGRLSEEEIAQMQFEQQLRNQMMMLELQRAEAEVMKLEAESMKLAAEAELKGGGLNSPEMQVKLEELEVRLSIARENLRLRQSLARLSAEGQLDRQLFGAQGQLLNTRLAAQEQRGTEVMKKEFQYDETLLKGQLQMDMERIKAVSKQKTTSGA